MRADYYKEEVEEESEEEDESEVEDESEEEKEEEEEEPPKVSRSFTTDLCVICLLKEPELLFIDCLYRCVCLECEETNPFRRCPSCRTHISIKVKI